MLITAPAAATVWYVDDDATGANTGTNWTDAFPDLQAALNVAHRDDGIWVAAGTYRPSRPTEPADPRTATFQLVNNVALYGGFAGTETDRTQRDPATNETTLSGDLAGNDAPVADPADLAGEPTRSENAYHVVTGSRTDATAILDGFTITAGNADGPDRFRTDSGAGMYIHVGSPTIANCTFSRNAAALAGGGMYINNPPGDFPASPTITNCTFRGNAAADSGGGGMRYERSSPTLTDCTFHRNSAEGGGGVSNWGDTLGASNATLTNCTFSENLAENNGGAMDIFFSMPMLTNCTFQGNTAMNSGGGIFNRTGSPTVCNSSFAGNMAANTGGGMWNANGSDATLTNCIFTTNSATNGGGMRNSDSNATLTNCTFAGNTATNAVGGMDNSSSTGSSATLTNCILWGNSDPGGMDATAQIHINIGTPVVVNFSDVQGGAAGMFVGPGNIDVDPRLTPDGHLRAGSPCIDAGSSDGAPPTDQDGESRPQGAGMDIGSDEFVDSDGDGLPDWWEQKYFGSPTAADPAGDPDGDGLTNLQEYEEYGSNPMAPPYHVDAANGDDAWNGLFSTDQGNGMDGPKRTLQAGLDVAANGDTVLVAPGTYSGPGNNNIDYGRKAVVLRALGGPTVTTIDCGGAGRTVNADSVKGAFAVLEGFTIQNGQADFGGALRADQSRLMLKDCVLIGNTATTEGGGLYSNLSNPTISGLTIQANAAPLGDGGVIERSNVTLEGALTLEAGTLVVRSSWFYGPGRIELAAGTRLRVTGTPGGPPTRIRSDITGTGTIEIDFGAELILEGQAHLTGLDPDNRIHVVSNGLFRARGTATIANAHLTVTRASFEGEAIVCDNEIISNSAVEAEAGAPFGQFFVEDSVIFERNVIHADGDRYLDFDPALFAGTIAATNRIFVTITEGIGGTRGGLLEARGADLPARPCPPDEFACLVGSVPPFDTTSWRLERLELVDDAKVNLTNRFDFGNGNRDEVVFVKDLVLGRNAVLNTAFNRLYYGSLTMGEGARFANEPLLGFSLNNIAFEDDTEFLARIEHNNTFDPNPDFNPAGDCKAPSSRCRLGVERVTNVAPDAAGVMRLRNLVETLPGSPRFGEVVTARAKGVFSKASEDRILIQFEYLFCAPGGELVVYLSDNPNVGEGNVEVARLRHPPTGRPGAAGSGRFGLFRTFADRGELNFLRGVRIELELVGPAGTCVRIDNFDPLVICTTTCGDLSGDGQATEIDFLVTIGEYGRTVGDSQDPAPHKWCLDAARGTNADGDGETDGYIDVEDLLLTDLNLDVPDLCALEFPIVPSEPPTSGPAVAAAGTAPADALSSLIVAGKNGELEDAVYTLDAATLSVTATTPPASGRPTGNGRLVADHAGELYQLHTGGLGPLSDGETVIPPGRTTFGSGDVIVGLVADGPGRAGRAVQDVAFDSAGNAYITPVVVVPLSGRPYKAAARLELLPTGDPPYLVTQLYGDAPDDSSNTNLDRQQLREIEVASDGRLYVTSALAWNSNDWLMVYDSNTGAMVECVNLTGNGKDPGCTNLTTAIRGPVGLHVTGDAQHLYLSSSTNSADAATTTVYRLDTNDLTATPTQIMLTAMGHVTAITSDATTGDVFVLGFTMTDIPGEFEPITPATPTFFAPYAVRMPQDAAGPVAAVPVATTALALPISAVFIPPPNPLFGDADGDNDVDLADYLAFINCFRGPGIALADGCIVFDADADGDVDLSDLLALQAAFTRAH